MPIRFTENEVWVRLETLGKTIEDLMEGLHGSPPGDPVARAEFARRQEAIMQEPLTTAEKAKVILMDAKDRADALEEAESRFGPGCLPFLQRDYSKDRNYTDNELRRKLAKVHRELFKVDPLNDPNTTKEERAKIFDERHITNEEYFETEKAFIAWVLEEGFGEPQFWGLHTPKSPDYWRLVQIDILEAAPWGFKWDKE